MFMSSISILVFCFVKILAESPPTPDELTTTLGPNEQPDGSPPPPLLNPTTEPCRGDRCRPPPNLIAPIVGGFCGILAVVLITIFIVWIRLKRKNKKTKEVQMTPPIKYIEQPPLYTGAISTVDSTSRLYGMSASRKDSIDSHHYEKINYNE